MSSIVWLDIRDFLSSCQQIMQVVPKPRSRSRTKVYCRAATVQIAQACSNTDLCNNCQRGCLTRCGRANRRRTSAHGQCPRPAQVLRGIHPSRTGPMVDCCRCGMSQPGQSGASSTSRNNHVLPPPTDSPIEGAAASMLRSPHRECEPRCTPSRRTAWGFRPEETAQRETDP